VPRGAFSPCRSPRRFAPNPHAPARSIRRVAAQRQLHDSRDARSRDPHDHRSETIVWRNISSRAATDLQFHLYWNAWRDARSTFMRERALGGAAPDNPPRRSDEWGRIDIVVNRAHLAGECAI
jgi:hypothetical protein